MNIEVFKYSGAGNDFLLINNLDGNISLSQKQISKLCDRHYGIGADGIILLENSEEADFKMNFYNNDGSNGMFCGNGGRCIVDFAEFSGLQGEEEEGFEEFIFEAADGYHSGVILGEIEDKIRVTISLNEVLGKNIERLNEKMFWLNTGCDHLVVFREGVKDMNVVEEGRELRYSEEFAPNGVNVNFVEIIDGFLFVRTYEKGVEDETLACGTGVVAAGIAAYAAGLAGYETEEDGIIWNVKTSRDYLSIMFVPLGQLLENGERWKEDEVFADNIYLSGPVERIAKCEINV